MNTDLSFGNATGINGIVHRRTIDIDEMQVTESLTEGGEVTMPFGPTDWSEGFGMVTDRFGAHWMISAPAQMA